MILNKHKKLDRSTMKHMDSSIYGYRNESPHFRDAEPLDPILKASEKSKQDLDDKFKKFQQNKIDLEAQHLISKFCMIINDFAIDDWNNLKKQIEHYYNEGHQIGKLKNFKSPYLDSKNNNISPKRLTTLKSKNEVPKSAKIKSVEVKDILRAQMEKKRLLVSFDLTIFYYVTKIFYL